MPPERLIIDQFITFMNEKGKNNCEIALLLGLTEGAIRHRLKRMGQPDLRKQRPSELDSFREVIGEWTQNTDEGSGLKRRPPLKLLYFHLRNSYQYQGSYDSVCHYIKRHFPDYWQQKPFIRIETPPGVLMTTDWKESVPVCFGSDKHIVRVNFLVFQLAFSRKCVVLVFHDRKLESFLVGHQEAFERFGGVPQAIRTDCLSSAVTQYKGQETVLNTAYGQLLNSLGIKAFPSRPGTPRDKGKVERLIRSVMDRVFLHKKVFTDLVELQRMIDQAVMELEADQRCGATGRSVTESFAYEKNHMKAYKKVSIELPLKERLIVVGRDATVSFVGNMYQLERRFVGRTVYCIQTRLHVRIYSDNELIEEKPYLPESRGMVVLSKKALSDPAVQVSSWTREKALEVAERQVDIYQKISIRGYQ